MTSAMGSQTSCDMQSSIDYILAGIDRGQTANDLCSRVKKSWLTIVIQASLSQWQQWYYLPEEVSNDVSTVVNGLGQGIDCQNGGGSSPSPVNAPGGSGQAVPQNAGTQSSQQPAQGAWGNLPPVKDDYAKDPKRTMAAPQCVQFLTTLGGKVAYPPPHTFPSPTHPALVYTWCLLLIAADWNAPDQ